MYVAVKGGEEAIANAHALLAARRRGDPAVPEIGLDQIREQLALAVDRVMAEGSLYDRDLAALAVKQARGDLIEAIFLARAFRTTLPRFGASVPLDTGAMRIHRRISATFKDLPGGQVLGPTFDYTHRLMDERLATAAAVDVARHGAGAPDQAAPGDPAAPPAGDGPRQGTTPAFTSGGEDSPTAPLAGEPGNPAAAAAHPAGRHDGDAISASPIGSVDAAAAPPPAIGVEAGGDTALALEPETALRADAPLPRPAAETAGTETASAPHHAAGPGRQNPMPRVTDLLGDEGLIEPSPADDGAPPADLTRAPLAFPADRAVRLQALARGDEGFLLGLGYSTQRGYARTHPFVGEIRFGEAEVHLFVEELGFEVSLGEISLTECQSVNQFLGSASAPPQFTRGYGLVFGQCERKAMAMALVDRALRGAELGEEQTAPAQDEEFVLSHCDNVQATGFVEHLKLPHYVDFQAELELVRRMRAEHPAVTEAGQPDAARKEAAE